MVIRRIVDRSPGYSELSNPRSRILIKLYGGDDYVEFGAPAQPTSAATAPASAATAPALIDHLAVGLARSQAPASSASSVAQLLAPGGVICPPAPLTPHPLMRRVNFQEEYPRLCRQLKTAKVTRVTNSCINIGYDERHLAAPMAELHSCLAHDIGHVIRSHCPMKWKSWTVMPDETKTETNYNLEDLDDESFAYVNRLFSERYKQWKSELHHYFEAFDDPQVALQEGCPKELEGREDIKVNKGNRKKKTLLHHSGSRPFSYRMDARRQFKDDDGGESQLVLQESASQLPPDTPIKSVVPPQDAGFQILTVTLINCREETGDILSRDGECQAEGTQTPFISAVKQSGHCFDSTGGHSSESDVVILQSLAQSGIPVPHFDAPTSEPVHPEHPH
ncbi:hypothetical protein Prudu_1478S000200 [Prunus dulcis]|uniref:Ankyrin repeat family protein n=1 Tax=Prunus dulcis TaxID=3755 RepID=A0A5H2XRM2_PRUDU|nr:hypothetical protein Prudu_1478S000200 [Prunus dulcis]